MESQAPSHSANSEVTGLKSAQQLLPLLFIFPGNQSMHTSNKLANPAIHPSLLSRMKEAGGVFCDQRRRPRIVFPWRLSAAEEVGGKSFSSGVQSGSEWVRNSPVSSPSVSLDTQRTLA